LKGRCSLAKKTNIVESPKEELLTIGWWNGGGGLKKRLSVNPGLLEFIATKPDIWTYSESGITSSQNLSLDEYEFFA